MAISGKSGGFRLTVRLEFVLLFSLGSGSGYWSLIRTVCVS